MRPARRCSSARVPVVITVGVYYVALCILNRINLGVQFFNGFNLHV